MCICDRIVRETKRLWRREANAVIVMAVGEDEVVAHSHYACGLSAAAGILRLRYFTFSCRVVAI